MTSDLKCLRCRHTWKRRTWNRLPRQCPNCHRNDWNKVEVGPVGRPSLKAKEVMPNAAGSTTSPYDVSGEHRAEMMSTSAIEVQDTSTDDLLNHLLEQIKREGV